jgi:hypothetical protein
MGGRAGAAEPLLLPELSGGHSGGASVSGAVFNLSTSIIGAGIMSIPAAMRVLGVAPALVLIAAVAFLSDVSVEFMLRYTGWAPSGPPSYAGIMGDAFGRAGAAALNVFVAFTTAGTLVVYLIIIGKLALATTRALPSYCWVCVHHGTDRIEDSGRLSQGTCCPGARGRARSTPGCWGSCSARGGGPGGSS